MHIAKLFCLSLLMIFLVSCGSSAPVDSTASPTIGGDTTTSPPPMVVTNGTLTLVIFSPQNGAIVLESPLEILGSVSTDSVLTLQGERYILPPGDFALMVELEPGVNELEFSAGSLLGNEVELTLVVTYQP
jgi:hypothetical protein